MRSYLLVILAMLSVLAGAVNAAAVPVGSCVNLTSPGSYVLNSSLSGAPNPDPVSGNNYCIGIASSGVSLDCNGFGMNGSGSGGVAVLFNGSSSSSVLKNCPSITDYSIGVYLGNAANDNVTNVSVANSPQAFSVVRIAQ